MRRLAILALVSVGYAAAAQAQTSDPYRNPWARTGPITLFGDSSPKDAQQVMRRFARCTANYHHAAVGRYLLLSLGTWVPEKDYREIVDSRCLGFLSGRLEMGELAYRGALAEEMMRWGVGHSPIDPTKAPPLDWTAPDPPTTDSRTGHNLSPDAIASRQKAHDAAVAASIIGHLGECVVRATPPGSLALLKTRTSEAEAKAFQAIVPQIAGCIQKGNTLTFTRTNLRSAIALSYYRLAIAGRASQQAAK